MAGNQTYDRPKSTVVNSTSLATTVLAAEMPTAVAAVSAGSTGALSAELRVDADESGGADVQTMWKITATPSIVGGKPQLAVVVTPVNASGVDGSAFSNTHEHPETADEWQAAAGRARQA